MQQLFVVQKLVLTMKGLKGPPDTAMDTETELSTSS